MAVADVVAINGGSAVGEEDFNINFLNFKAGDLAACMASNAQRISPIGEAGFVAEALIEVDLLRGEEFL